ncbi:MAG: hypothetical protein Q6373_013820 [Candidatus Sigynarchaeota archaeon]
MRIARGPGHDRITCDPINFTYNPPNAAWRGGATADAGRNRARCRRRGDGDGDQPARAGARAHHQLGESIVTRRRRYGR